MSMLAGKPNATAKAIYTSCPVPSAHILARSAAIRSLRVKSYASLGRAYDSDRLSRSDKVKNHPSIDDARGVIGSAWTICCSC